MRKAWALGASVVSAGLLIIAAGCCAPNQKAAKRRPVADEYQAYVQDVQKGGERFLRLPTESEMQELDDLWPTVPPEQNAAFLYVRAWAVKTFPTNAPGSIQSNLPYAGDIAPLKAHVTANAEAIQLYLKAASMPDCQFVPLGEQQVTMEQGTVYPIYAIAEARVLLLDASFAEEAQGRSGKACDILLASLAIPNQVQTDTYIMNAACCEFAQNADALDRLMANANLPQETLARIMAVCAQSELTQERYARAIRRTLPAMRFVWKPEVWPKLQADYVRVGATPLASTPAEQIAIESTVAENALAILELPLSESLRKDFPFEQRFRKGLDDNSSSVLTADFFRNVLATQGEFNARLRALRIRAAIMLYEKAHGVPPDSLDALCPAFLPELPPDPFTGKRFSYTRKGGDWTLWSVGVDLTDDGGDDSAKVPWYHPNDIVSKNKMDNNAALRSRAGN